jgi:DNA mismatch endonuclease (patch repair protein)
MRTSDRMSRVHRHDTPIEVALRRAVWKRGVRFRVHLSGVEGRPDFGSKGLKIAVFVDGCFWHGCPMCYVAPNRNAKFWRDKVTYNKRRRREVVRSLEGDGWTVVQVWGHEIDRNLPKVAQRVDRVFRQLRT